MDKKTFVKLAQFYIRTHAYLDEVESHYVRVAKKYKYDTDFIGSPYSHSMLEDILELLGNNFSYFYFDCKCKFKNFNKNIEHEDGSHPNVKSLEQLYDYDQEYPCDVKF